jgi:hypothetical protein
MSQSSGSYPFVPPRSVEDLADCSFYHTMDIPGVGHVEGLWDLREGIDAYLGKVDFRGKRVLEIGTASGFVCFAMEARGANVIAYDLSQDYDWDIVPFPHVTDAHVETRKREIRRLNNAFWLAHKANGSSARVAYGTAYNVPETIGSVDIATYCCVLLHLRDPFLALAQGARLAGESVIIVEPFGRLFLLRRLLTRLRIAASRVSQRWELAGSPSMRFIPNARRGGPDDSWWILGPEILCRFLEVLGFSNTRISFHHQIFRGQRIRMVTVVGHRMSASSSP